MDTRSELERIGEELRERGLALREKSGVLQTIGKFLTQGVKGCILKTCKTCGAKYTPSAWMQLIQVGYQKSEDMDGEMRNCSCGSTLLLITRRP